MNLGCTRPASFALSGTNLLAERAPEERIVFAFSQQPRQPIENFGASGCWMMDPIGVEWSEENKNRLSDLLFSPDKGIGLSLWRFNIGAGDPNPDGYWHPWRRVECFQSKVDAPFDFQKQAGQQWFLKAAKQRGVEKLLAFTNSPPVWLTRNGRAFGEKNGTDSTNLKPGAEAEFGKFLARVLRHFADTGILFDYLSVVNEPNWGWDGGQEGCRYNNADIKRLIVAVDAELKAAKVRAELHLPDTGDIRSLLDDADYRAYRRARKPGIHLGNGNEDQGRGIYREQIREFLTDPALCQITRNCIAGHSYWSADTHHDLSVLRTQLRQNLNRYSANARYWMTEFCLMEHRRDLGMDTALRVAETIHYDLTAAEASAWHWWLALSIGDYKDGLIYTDYSEKGGPQNILPSKTLWALGNYSRFLRPGARRIQTATDALPDELLASAYLDHNKKRLVLVLINKGNTPRPIRLGCDHSVGPLVPYITSATEDLVKLSPLTGDQYTVPPRSVVTLLGDLRSGSSTLSTTTLSATSPRRLRKGSFLYEVHCGDNGSCDIGTGGRASSRWDMAFGPDPGTGYSWGYLSSGETGGRRDGDAPLQSVRWEDGNAPGDGLTYQFEVTPKAKLHVEVGFWDPWNNAGRAMDVRIGAQTLATELIVGNEKPLRQATVEAPSSGLLAITVVRSARATGPPEDPLLSLIRIREEGIDAPTA